MSQIIDLIPALKDIFEFINKINDKIKDPKLKLEAEPNEIFDAIESYSKEKSNNFTQIKSNKNEIDILKTKIFQLDQEFPKMESKVKDLSKEYGEIKIRLENKKNELNTINNELIHIKNEYTSQKKCLDELESEISDSWKMVEDKIQELSKLEEKHNQEIIQVKSENEQELLKLQTKLNEELNTAETEHKKHYDDLLSKFHSFRGKINSMNLLIKNGFINSELYQFINSLEKNKSLELNFICQTIKMEQDKAKNVVKKMIEKNGPINFDEKTGIITLKKEVEFR